MLGWQMPPSRSDSAGPDAERFRMPEMSSTPLDVSQ